MLDILHLFSFTNKAVEQNVKASVSSKVSEFILDPFTLSIITISDNVCEHFLLAVSVYILVVAF